MKLRGADFFHEKIGKNKNLRNVTADFFIFISSFINS